MQNVRSRHVSPSVALSVCAVTRAPCIRSALATADAPLLYHERLALISNSENKVGSDRKEGQGDHYGVYLLRTRHGQIIAEQGVPPQHEKVVREKAIEGAVGEEGEETERNGGKQGLSRRLEGRAGPFERDRG